MVEIVLEAARASASPTLPSDKGRVSEGFCQLIPRSPWRRFMAEEFAAQIVRRNPLAPGNSHFARTRVHETILALRLNIGQENMWIEAAVQVQRLFSI